MAQGRYVRQYNAYRRNPRGLRRGYPPAARGACRAGLSHRGNFMLLPDSQRTGKIQLMTDTLDMLFQTILDRKANPKPDSYTNRLFEAGLDEIAKKVGEEAVEVVIAAEHQGNERLISELADLVYHSLVLMAQMGVRPEDVAAELRRRHAPREG